MWSSVCSGSGSLFPGQWEYHPLRLSGSSLTSSGGVDSIDVKINLDKVGELLELADCRALSKIEVLSGGWANSNYLVTCDDGTKVVLKIWREKIPDAVQEMNSGIDWIAKHGVPTPAPSN